MSKENIQRVRHILEAIENIEQFTKNVTREAFIQDEEKFSAVVYQLHIVGEAMRRIDDDFRGMYLDVPAEAIIGLRNKIVHEY
ncbi:MAG: HepT-like ribonuclease domain-containing protein, partial [Patescibacteria group bacterium]